MSQSAAVRNPFMLMLNPEVVLAAVEKSERLAQLNRHLCRPLDRLTPLAAGANEGGAGIQLDEGDLGDDPIAAE